MRILDQTLPAVVDEPVEPVVTPARTPPVRSPFRYERIVLQSWPRWRAIAEIDQPSLAERVRVHIILLCEHETGRPLVLASCRRQTAWREPHPMWWTSSSARTLPPAPRSTLSA